MCNDFKTEATQPLTVALTYLLYRVKCDFNRLTEEFSIFDAKPRSIFFRQIKLERSFASLYFHKIKLEPRSIRKN